MLKGDALKAAIRAAGWTQKSLAEDLGISAPTMTLYVQRGVAARRVHHVAQRINVPAERLRPDMFE